jgi:hypothetical protein
VRKENRDYLEMTYRSIQCFALDGRFQLAEFEALLAIALRDGVIDANEQRILNAIINRLSPAELSGAVGERIAQLRSQHAF